MAFVRANPNQYLLVGRKGVLENRGVAVQTFLLPGTVFVLVPSIKQEASFEFTQETQDGIPLRFKGIVIYRITDPIAAAYLFDFSGGAGIVQINALLTHVSLGELRDAVSHMTMAECIEQRKTTLSGVVQAALEATVHPEGQSNDWGISVEVAQLAQVFIVDAELRHQLEAEVRNEIKLKSDQSDIRTAEETELTSMASVGRVAEQKLATDRENLRRQEQLFKSEMATEEGKIKLEAPVRLLKLAREGEVLREELGIRDVKNQIRASEVEHDLFLSRAQQEMRREILPLEQAPQIVEAASKVLHGTNLSIYGEHAELLGNLAPIFEILARAAQQSIAGSGAASGHESP
jgi:regulator of protease activity HflC (stomatin/prohibitin superfamily)